MQQLYALCMATFFALSLYFGAFVWWVYVHDNRPHADRMDFAIPTSCLCLLLVIVFLITGCYFNATGNKQMESVSAGGLLVSFIVACYAGVIETYQLQQTQAEAS
jgi:uncharacterized membrane protein